MSELEPQETQPLLSHTTCQDIPTPLPKEQIAILCLLRILDPLCFTQIFPYINQFLVDLRVTDDPTHIGFYSGLVESSFAFTQLLTTYPWGICADRFGRRSVVLLGVAGLTLTTVLFGFSKTFVGLLSTRALAGLMSGNVAVIPTMLMELTDKSNQATAFPLFGFFWPLGSIIGPSIGGLLSNPATRYPEYFGYNIFRDFPYLLPCLLISGVSMVIFSVSYLFLEETLNLQEGSRYSQRASTATGVTVEAAERIMSVRELLSVPMIRALCVSGCTLSLVTAAFDVLFVLFCFTPVSHGGLGFSAARIGFALSTSGFAAAFLQVFLMPPVLRNFDHTKIYHLSMTVWPLVFLSIPLVGAVARAGVNADDESAQLRRTAFLWCAICLVLGMARIGFIAYSINILLIKKFAPNSKSVASTTALIQFCICLSRAVSPAFASSMFAYSLKHPSLMWGNLWVAVMAMIGLLGTLTTRQIVRESTEAQN